jgi:hypothetical protein
MCPQFEPEIADQKIMPRQGTIEHKRFINGEKDNEFVFTEATIWTICGYGETPEESTRNLEKAILEEAERIKMKGDSMAISTTAHTA